MSRQENDTIYRQETTKHLKHRLYETAMNNLDLAGVFSEIADNRVETWIEELPSAQQRWIPCSERLPEPPSFCLVTTDGSHNDVIDIALYMSDGWHKASKVLAWMPLPEPYTEEGHD